MNAKTVENLLRWKADLPSTIQVDVEDKESSHPPHILLLQYFSSSSKHNGRETNVHDIACNITKTSFTLTDHTCPGLITNHSPLKAQGLTTRG